MNNRNVTQKQKKNLIAQTPFCNMCLAPVSDNNSNIAEIAHIEGLNPTSARYNEYSSDEYRNSDDNLMVLCPTCHTVIDKLPERYSIEVLKANKNHAQNICYGNIMLLTKEDKNFIQTHKEDLYKIFLHCSYVGIVFCTSFFEICDVIFLDFQCNFIYLSSEFRTIISQLCDGLNYYTNWLMINSHSEDGEYGIIHNTNLNYGRIYDELYNMKFEILKWTNLLFNIIGVVV